MSENKIHPHPHSTLRIPPCLSMPADNDKYDLFISYARADNSHGWISQFVDELRARHDKLNPAKPLTWFFDKNDIRSGDDWRHTLNEGIYRSRLFLAFISPAYFASEPCRDEWRAWMDAEIAKHILKKGACPVYFVEVPGFAADGASGAGEWDEQKIAAEIASLSTTRHPDATRAEAPAIIREVRRRNYASALVQPFDDAGWRALRENTLAQVLENLASDIAERAGLAAAAAASESTVPPYNKNFSGRLEELTALRDYLSKDDRTGVIHGIHGLGGVGKTELAFAYAHAYAHAYPGGRFWIPCEGKSTPKDAILQSGEHLANFHEIRPGISDEERKHPDDYFAAILRVLDARLKEKGHILLVLDNVTDTAFLRRDQTDPLTTLGERLHLLATTRLPPLPGINTIILGELPDADALHLMERHRPFTDDTERAAALEIIRKLGGFTIAVELTAAYLAAKTDDLTYAHFAKSLDLDRLEKIAGDTSDAVALRRHQHERSFGAILAPVLSSLSPAGRCAMEYAALLPPDAVALPWLETLVEKNFPDAFQITGEVSTPWKKIWGNLMRLGLFSRCQGESSEPNLVRTHRLVQELIKREWKDAQGGKAKRQADVNALIEKRSEILQNTTQWENARWELVPMANLANLWADEKHPKAALLLNQAGLRLVNLARYGEAEPLYLRALSMDEANHGPDHPDVARDLKNLAGLLRATNRHGEAERRCRRAWAIFEAVHGPNHPDVASCLNSLAGVLDATNRHAEAEPLYLRALSIDEANFGPNHSNVARDLNGLAVLLYTTKRYNEAERLYRRALEIDEASHGPDHPNVARDLNNLAELLRATNRLAEAEQFYRRALEIIKASYGPNHPNVATCLNNLAGLLRATNQLVAAGALSQHASAITAAIVGAYSYHHVFVCYCHDRGYKTANRLAKELRASGYNVFLDEETPRSGKFNEQLHATIERCTDFVLVLPKGGLDRCDNPEDCVRKELLHALKHKKNIIPVCLRGFKWPEKLPEEFRELPNYQKIPEADDALAKASIQILKSCLWSRPPVIAAATLLPGSSWLVFPAIAAAAGAGLLWKLTKTGLSSPKSREQSKPNEPDKPYPESPNSARK